MDPQQDFQDLLRKQGLTLICPVCGGTSWVLVRSDLQIPNTSGRRELVFLIQCIGCSHQRFFTPADPGGELGAE